MWSYLAYLKARRLEKNEQWEQALAIYDALAKVQTDVSANLAYRLGYVAEKIGDWKKAEPWLQHAVQKLPSQAQWFYRLGLAQELSKKYREAAQTYRQALALKPGNAQWHYRLGKVLWIVGEGADAEESLNQAIRLEPCNSLYVHELAMAMHKQGRTWQEAEVLQQAVMLDSMNAEWQFELGDALDKLNRFAEAAQAFQKANCLRPGNAMWHFHEGYAWERAGDNSRAQNAYTAACATDQVLKARELGIGVFHESRGFWPQAATAYAQEILAQPHNAELHYRLGLAHDRGYCWEKAEAGYRQALANDPDHPDWHYRLGFVLERQSQWKDAAQAYQAALDRSSSYNSQWHYRLGYVLMQAGALEQATQAFCETRIFKKAYGISTQAYQKNADLMKTLIYREYHDNLLIRKNVILYESNQGASIGCNPLSIYLHLLKDPDYADFRHVWVINDRSRVPQCLKGHSQVFFVERESDLYLRYLASAAYLVNNNTFPPYFVRKTGQKYLNTWHGTPLKFLGRDMIDGFMEHRNATRNFLQATHIISPNPHTSRVLRESFDIQGIDTGEIAETGYPRIDRTLCLSPSQQKSLKEKIGIQSHLPIVLYAPTWRGTLNGGVKFDVERLINDMNAFSTLDCNLLFRGHHMLEEILSGHEAARKYIVPTEVDTNELLSIVDILITDYSSIFFDFLPLGRPILFYAYDVEQYTAERGLYFSMTSMPGSLCLDINQVIEKLQARLDSLHAWNPDELYRKAQNNFCGLEDGNSSKRAVEFFLEDKTDWNLPAVQTERISILMYAGPLLSNGITSAALNLLSVLDYRKFDVTIIIDGEDLKYIERVDRMKYISRQVRLVARIGRQLQTIEQKWISDYFSRAYDISGKMEEIYEDAFSLEFQRMFSTARFDVVLNFDGYNRFWAALCGAGAKADKKIIYLHNSMHGEWTRKYPNLAGLFYLYKHYQHLISVSKSVAEENQMLIGPLFGISAERFGFSNNPICAEEIKQKAQEPLTEDVREKLSVCKGKIFVGCGRLSPEKGFEKLIDAFFRVIARYPESKLIIVGDGPLREELQQKIVHRNLEKSVLLLGYIKNPFPIIARADCFVFSSDYEGQGLVVLEALILERPVISTDVVGPRSILENGEGVLVPNHPQALAEAMLSFMENGAPKSTFNYEKYTACAISSFERLITS